MAMPWLPNVANHLRFTVAVKFGKMSVANAKFKRRCKMSGEFALLGDIIMIVM